ncbi:GNAT family N-acetyltransferase [Pelagibius sp. 7325]|uniref:GNAT family N-acetyltransferase n=1 Tax=Pelagibius sp. 7325 TaxID=3131994 RepID=UPI0030EB1B66
MIRTARPEDRARIEAIVETAYRPYLARMNRKPAPMVDDYARRIADGQTLVLEADGAVAGILVLEDHPDDHGGYLLLDNIAVDPAYHGRGLGKRLMTFTEEEARRRGYRVIELYTNEVMVENIALYLHLGYAEIKREQVAGYDRVYLRKNL